MSSVRIGHLARGSVGTNAVVRTDDPPSGVSFALALDAAGPPQKAGTGKQFAENEPDAETAPHKRTTIGPSDSGQAAGAVQSAISLPAVEPLPLAAGTTIQAASSGAARLEERGSATAPALNGNPWGASPANSPISKDVTSNAEPKSRAPAASGQTVEAQPVIAQPHDDAASRALSHGPDAVSLASGGTTDPQLTVGGSIDAANAGPSLQRAPSISTASAPSAVPTLLTQSLPGAGRGQSAADDGETASDGSDRRHLRPMGGASGSSATTGAAPLSGASSSSPATGPAASPDSPTDPTGTGSMADQVAGHVVRMLSSGSRETVMRLHPPELGEVTVRVVVSGRDVSAWFGSPQQQVQSAISGAIVHLQTSLGSAGYNLNGAWVGADTSGSRQQGQSTSAPPPAALAAGISPSLPGVAGLQPPASGVNIYV
jgi:hypothetical protein